MMTPDGFAFTPISAFLLGVVVGANLVAALLVAERPPGGGRKPPPNPPIT